MKGLCIGIPGVAWQFREAQEHLVSDLGARGSIVVHCGARCEGYESRVLFKS